MIRELNSLQIQSFIKAHAFDDLNELCLKYKSVFGLPSSIVIDQILGRRKAKNKLPLWHKNDQVIYPPSINIEQSSSERTAQYKINWLTANFGNTNLRGGSLGDLTGGFGIDSFFFSKIFKEVYFIEANRDLLDIARHNHQLLGAQNINYFNTLAEDFLSVRTENFEFIYIDPSRRSKGNQKIFSLNQCEPDVVFLQHKIWGLTNNLLIKASPLLDIQKGISDLMYVKDVIVISVDNECKEVLFCCKKKSESEAFIHAIDLGASDQAFSFRFSEERLTDVKFSDPLKYLYEPNASILKSGGFKTIASVFNIFKLQTNTHLYTSNHLVENFPGRIFQIESLVKADPKSLKKYFPDGKANITTRNYTLSVDDLRKKTSLKEGGEKFLIGFSGLKKKFLVAATRLG